VNTHVHIIVKGLVQGVGFRWFVARVASGMNLSGFVRNLPDGAVEISAGGEQGLLHELIKEVRIGPRSARVTNLRIEWGAAAGPQHGTTKFEIH